MKNKGVEVKRIYSINKFFVIHLRKNRYYADVYGLFGEPLYEHPLHFSTDVNFLIDFLIIWYVTPEVIEYNEQENLRKLVLDKKEKQ